MYVLDRFLLCLYLPLFPHPFRTGPADLAFLVLECTSFEPTERPSFEEIYTQLKLILEELEADEAAAYMQNAQVLKESLSTTISVTRDR